MTTALLAALALVPQSGPAADPWSQFIATSSAEARQRRKDLVPFASRESGLAPGERENILWHFRSAWDAGRTEDAHGLIAGAVAKVGKGDEEILRVYTDLLARSGKWSEVRDLVAVNLPEFTRTAQPHLYILALVETDGDVPELHQLCLRAVSLGPRLRDEEIGRVFPRDRDGRRRLAWDTYATTAMRFETMMADGRSQRRGWSAYQVDWAVREAYRRFPDDPLAALWASRDLPLTENPRVAPSTAEEARKEARAAGDRLRRHFAPALRRLRPEDLLYTRILDRIAEVAYWPRLPQSRPTGR